MLKRYRRELRYIRRWVAAHGYLSFDFKRQDGMLWPRFGFLPQHQEAVLHYRIPRPLFQKLY